MMVSIRQLSDGTRVLMEILKPARRFRSVVLINPYPETASGINEATIYQPLGLAYLAAFLRENGIHVQIIDANILKLNKRKILEFLGATNHDLVGISMNIVTGAYGIELARMLKEKMESTICIGGPLVSASPKAVLKACGADIAVVGEGEKTFLDICDGMDCFKLKGAISVLPGNEFVWNGPRDLINPLDSLPYPAYDLLPPPQFYHSRTRKRPMAAIITSRGCPFQCTFCSHSVFGKCFRTFSPEYIMGEIDLLVSRHGIRQLDILDDNFILDIGRAERILEMLIEKDYNLLINLQNGIRVENLNRTIIKKMKNAGVFKVGIGIESGSRRILGKIKKDLDLDKVVQAISWFKEEGILTVGFFIIGFPEDTRETIEETINFAIKANPTHCNVAILLPLPGTEIYDELMERKLLKGDLTTGITTGFFDKKTYHNCPGISEDELIGGLRRVYARFNFRISKIIEILLQIRSFSELRWLLKASLPMVKNLF